MRTAFFRADEDGLWQRGCGGFLEGDSDGDATVPSRIATFTVSGGGLLLGGLEGFFEDDLEGAFAIP
jgi:hypothetical protein